MHNGVISDFVSIKRELCNLLDHDTYSNISGGTDSEHLGGLFVHFLTGGRGKQSWDEDYTERQMNDALLQAVKTVIELQKKVLGDKSHPNSLNLAVTDGTKLVAYRFRNNDNEQPPSLYYSTTAGVTLNRKYPDHPDGIQLPQKHEDSRKASEKHGDHVIVASEPSTYKEEDWTLIGKNQVLLVGVDGKAVLEDLPYDRAWDSQDVISAT